jgi:hypothetical protein
MRILLRVQVCLGRHHRSSPGRGEAPWNHRHDHRTRLLPYKLSQTNAKITAKKVIDDLKPVMDPLRCTFEMYNGKQPGDPVKGAKLIVEALTESERCANRALPPRLALGSDAVTVIAGILGNEKKDLEAWKDLSATTDHDN